MSGRHEKEKGVNVQVLLRCRPFNPDELRNNAPQVITCDEYRREVAVSQNIAGKQFDRVFTFDKVFGPSAHQRDLYEQAVVPIVNEVLEGFNCTIFAYGQTGTGKTYTMEGECKTSKNGPKGQLPTDAGVIPRAVKQIFDTLESQNAEYSVKVTFLELYNEEITDLLAPEEISKVALEDKQKKLLPLMEDGKGGVLVRGLEEEIVANAGEIFQLLERGSAKRRTAETLLNKQSSRSHSLFSITIHIKEATPEGEELIKCGKLNLVDLAGSENISRSGARDGRAREAGEINKSLLTLGRVITALVEHLGHIPYRDSKLTRLLRDSLGGRTKTCIIATVSPSVHCLEETLSTLDYAHRAKHIKNRPEINQKMMKSTLIKDLYGEIERLKAEVYAAREKNGVYIPKERYYQEETEKKAMVEQIEQTGVLLETHQKQYMELQEKYEAEVQHSTRLSDKLEATQKTLEQTNNLLSATEEELKKSKYALKEKDFVILEQKKAEDALAHQACLLRSDLEKSTKDNALLFSKLGREDELNASNRKTVNTFQSTLVEKIGILSDNVAASMNEQSGHLQSVEKLCISCLGFHEKSMVEFNKKVNSSKATFISHLEAMQNVVRLHKAGANANLEEIASLASANSCSLEHLLAMETGKATAIFDDLQNTLLNHQGELENFAKQLRERFDSMLAHSKEITDFTIGVLDNLGRESLEILDHASQSHEKQDKCLSEFRDAYEEQSKSEVEKLLADVTHLVSNHMLRQQELVDKRLAVLRDSAVGNKIILDDHALSIEGITKDAKRKWHTFSMQAADRANDGVDFSCAKHCRMEGLLQQCITNVDAASKHWNQTCGSISEMNNTHITAMGLLVSNAAENNEQHDSEVCFARKMAEQHLSTSSKDIMQYFESVSEQDRALTTKIMSTVETHTDILHRLQEDHLGGVADIKEHTQDVFQDSYMDYEPTGMTPVRSDPEVPSKGKIESLRSMPTEALLAEFRENHPYNSTTGKQTPPNPSLIPRLPLTQLN